MSGMRWGGIAFAARKPHKLTYPVQQLRHLPKHRPVLAEPERINHSRECLGWSGMVRLAGAAWVHGRCMGPAYEACVH